MHYLTAYAMHARLDEEQAEFDEAIDRLSLDHIERLEETLRSLTGRSAAARYRSAAIACALRGVTARGAVRGFVRASGMFTGVDAVCAA